MNMIDDCIWTVKPIHSTNRLCGDTNCRDNRRALIRRESGEKTTLTMKCDAHLICRQMEEYLKQGVLRIAICRPGTLCGVSYELKVWGLLQDLDEHVTNL